ncbi:MAG: hypothetical protein IKH06_02645 [Clostridiales bacterium]|nr:hypothetical protein [Clostridiales bacterium]
MRRGGRQRKRRGHAARAFPCPDGRLTSRERPPRRRPSYGVKVGDQIEIKEKARTSQHFKDIAEVTGSRRAPEWVESDLEKFAGKIIKLPTRDQIDVPVNEVQIVELYSK